MAGSIPKPLMVPDEAAAFLLVSVETLAQWRSQRRGPPYIKLGRAVRYRVNDLEGYLAEHTVEPLTGAMPSGRLVAHDQKESRSGETRPARRAGACSEAQQGRIV
jgi:hypothetical protein